MNLSTEKLNNISSIFESVMYNTEANVYESIETIDAELNVIRTKGNKKNNFKCNKHITNKELALKDYGLDIDVNLMLTTNYIDIVENDYVEIENKYYRVIAVLDYDTHVKVFINEDRI